ncbi:MAG: hypothetical protein KGL39_17975 [Patescibacteria group bacterium]|nr:hypothetical protein [Patescibacteria group bacterium]
MKTESTSWIIIHRDTGRVITETWTRELAENLKPEYEAVPIKEYLAGFNRRSALNAALRAVRTIAPQDN